MADGEIRTGKVPGLTKQILLGLGAALLIAGIVLMILSRGKPLELLNPLSPTEKITKVPGEMSVVGFLPTWELGKTRTYGTEIDQLVFSAVGVSEDGSLIWDIQAKKLNSDDYIKLKNNITQTGGKNILGIELFDDKGIDALIASDEAKNELYSEVKGVMEAGNFDGVNIDFEYMSNPIRILDDDFSEFLDGARAAGWKNIGVDIFANTIVKGNKDGLDKLLSKVDEAIVMAYDFHRPSSITAGSVAPIGAEAGQRSINEIMEDIMTFGLQKDKIIMAYPLYGYEWRTADQTLGSQTVTGGSGKTVFYEDGIGITGVNWDDLSMTPWATWMEAVQKSKIVSQKVGKKIKKTTVYYTVGQPYEAYFENEESLQIKMELTKQAQLGGVGFWALGYEGSSSDLISNLKKSLLEK